MDTGMASEIVGLLSVAVDVSPKVREAARAYDDAMTAAVGLENRRTDGGAVAPSEYEEAILELCMAAEKLAGLLTLRAFPTVAAAAL